MFHRLVNDCCTPESIWILKQLYLIGLDVPSPINVGRQLGWVCVGVMNDLLPSLVHYSWYKRPLAAIFNVQVVDGGGTSSIPLNTFGSTDFHSATPYLWRAIHVLPCHRITSHS